MPLHKVIKLCVLLWTVQCIRGFQTNVKSCGGTFSGYQFTISSPKYPELYSPNIECVYWLQGILPSQCQPTFYFQFLDFDLEATENCAEDYLQIGSSNIFCGFTKGLRKYETENGSLKITFHSGNKRKVHRGFKILVTTSDCKDKHT